ncbi:hypothetical protein ACQKCF_04960 [Psychrobacter proteolyticus]|uniref:hypothetical protein n=1 Tax=Psychrobacter proteolyticus TaxID=147825 RepID=UPI003D001E7E
MSDSNITNIILGSFNNRDRAFVVWLFVVFIFIYFKVPDISTQLKQLLKYLFQKIIAIVFLMLLLNTIISVYILKKSGFWDYGQFRNTIWWFFGVGFINIFRAVESRDVESFKKKIIKDNLKMLLVLEFFINVYPLSFILELILLPVLFLVILFASFTDGKVEYKEVNTLFTTLQSIIGFILLTYSAWSLFNNLDFLHNFQLYQNFWNPIFLSLLSIPFLYTVFTYASYEITFSMMSIMIKDEEILSYAKRTSACKFNFNINKLNRFKKLLSTQPCKTKHDVDRLIKIIKEQSNKQKNPPNIDISKGLSPFQCIDYLKEYGLSLPSYDPLYLEKWRASSNILKTGKNAIHDYISYAFEGSENYVTFLSLSIRVNSDEHDIGSLKLFKEIAGTLLNKSTQTDLNNEMKDCIINLNSDVFEVNQLFSIIVNYKKHTQGEGFKYTFDIVHKTHRTYTANDFI